MGAAQTGQGGGAAASVGYSVAGSTARAGRSLPGGLRNKEAYVQGAKPPCAFMACRAWGAFLTQRDGRLPGFTRIAGCPIKSR